MPSERDMIAGAVLAGGGARRFQGRPKGRLEVRPGVSLVAHLLAQMEAAGVAPRMVVANAPELYRDCSCAVIPDLRPGLGPLAGIEAALTHLRDTGGSGRAVLFLPCDLPAMGQRQLRALQEAFGQSAAGVVSASTGSGERRRHHHLCAVVGPQVLAAVSAALDQGELAVGRLWRELGAEPVPFPDAGPFANINTPDDLVAWRAGRGQED